MEVCGWCEAGVGCVCTVSLRDVTYSLDQFSDDHSPVIESENMGDEEGRRCLCVCSRMHLFMCMGGGGWKGAVTAVSQP